MSFEDRFSNPSIAFDIFETFKHVLEDILEDMEGEVDPETLNMVRGYAYPQQMIVHLNIAAERFGYIKSFETIRDLEDSEKKAMLMLKMMESLTTVFPDEADTEEIRKLIKTREVKLKRKKKIEVTVDDERLAKLILKYKEIYLAEKANFEQVIMDFIGGRADVLRVIEYDIARVIYALDDGIFQFKLKFRNKRDALDEFLKSYGCNLDKFPIEISEKLGQFVADALALRKLGVSSKSIVALFQELFPDIEG